MGVFIMIIGVVCMLNVKNMAHMFASTILIIFGMWVHGAFDSVLGVCN